MWTDVHATQQYYPVLFSAFWFEHRLWGDDTLGYHLVNVLLHAASCCLLAFILRRLWATPATTLPAGSGRLGIVPAGTEWLAALLFAVHPVCVESVAWITEQKNTLSLFFYLLAGLAYLRFAERRRAGSYALASILFLLALGSKTATVTLPAALLVVQWWKRGKLSWRNDVAPLVPWLLAAVAMGLFTSWDERKVIGAEGAAFALSAGQRFLLAGRIVWFYAAKMVWPAGLNFFYPRWNVPAESSGWAGDLAAAVAVTVILWALRRKTRGPLAAWLLFVGALFPVLGFFNVFFFVFSYVNDHFQYLALLGPLAAAAGGAALALAAAPAWARMVGRGLIGVLLLGLALQVNSQSRLYRDSETLFRATLARNPASWMAHHILGFTLAKAPDRHAEAIAEYQEALHLNPDYPDAHFGLGVELARLPGRTADAIAEYERAVQLRPVYAEAHNNLAFELAKEPGHEAEAIAHYEAALRVRPDFAEAHANLADLLARQPNRLPEAMAHYEEALQLNPNLAWVHCNLALHLAQIPGRESEAIEHCQAALRLKPDFLEAYNGLGIIYARMGRLDEARVEWEAALRLNPHYETARNNLRRLDEMTRR
jgi:Flp pilus assembly protein TadD